MAQKSLRAPARRASEASPAGSPFLIRPRTVRTARREFRAGTSVLAFCIVFVALLLIPTTVSADDWVGGIPLTTVQTGTVTGDLWMDITPAPNWGNKDVTKTFTLPAAAVAEPGRVKWARLYISAYCGHMQNDYAFTMTTSFDGDDVSGYEQVWPETEHAPFQYMIDPLTWETLGNDNTAFGGGEHDPYKIINDHETRVTSDYFAYYDVTSMITSQTVNVNVNTVGSYDGRIKVISLVVAYDDPASMTQTTYWVNQGHDVCSYYTEDNFGSAAVGTTTFTTTGLSGLTSATLYADYMASNNGYYGFPTADNDFTYTGGTPPVEGTYTNLPLDRIPDVQGAYSGVDSWDVTSSVTGTSDTTFAYSRYFPGTGTAAFYKIPLAVLVVKKPYTPPPVAGFSGTPVSGIRPLTVLFTDESTNIPTSRIWDFGDGNSTWSETETTFAHTYTAAGTYTVALTATNTGGSDTETKMDYITVNPNINLGFTGANGAATVNPYPAYVFARETNNVQVKTIKNFGTDAATNIVVALYASDVSSTVPVGTATIASLAAGTTAPTQTIPDPTIREAGSSVTYTAVLDPDNLIAETNEADNIRTSSAKTVLYNGYKGKRYWDYGSDGIPDDITTKQTYDLHGNVVYYTKPDTAYRGVGWTDRTETWTAAELPVPAGASVEKVLLFFSYNWDQTPGGYPILTTTFNGNTIDLGTPYRDWSNFGAYSDYEYGLYPAYDVTSVFNVNSDNTLVTLPGSTDNKEALYPSTLMVIYSDPSSTRKQIFINEEYDYLGVSQSSYGTTLEEATAYAPFSGMTIDTGNVQNAYWHSFATNAGPAEGNVFFNGNNLGTNVFTGNTMTADAKVFDVKNYLTATGNEAAIQGTESGGMGAIQQILVVEYAPVPAPVAQFEADDTTPDVGQTVTFTDSSTNTPTSWAWTIEGTAGTDYQYVDSTSATSQNPHVQFLVAGTYDVTLIATNAGGSDDEAKTDYITASTAVVTLPGQTNPPTDPDSDGLYEDLNGNDRKDFNDVYLFYKNMDWINANEPLAAFDFNDNERIDFNDIYVLYKEMI